MVYYSTMGLFLATLKSVLFGTIADFLYTPIWWYTSGLWKQVRGVWGSFVLRQEALAVDVWLKNLFVPMYGQYDITGRVISFFVRLVQIVGRMVILLCWAVVLIAWIIVWIAIPVAVVYLIWLQI